MSDLLNDSQQVRSGFDLFARFLLRVHRVMPMLATPRRHRFQTPLLRARYGEMMTEFFGTAAIPEACVAVDSRPELCRALQRIFLRIHVVNTIAYDVITGFGFRQQLIAHAVDQDRMLTRTEVASEGNADCKRAQNGHSKLNSAVHEPLSV